MAFPQFGTSTIIVNGTVKEIETRSIACNTDEFMYSIPQRYAVNYTPYLFNILNMYPYPFVVGNCPYPCTCQKFYACPTIVPPCPPEFRTCNSCTQNQQYQWYNIQSHAPHMIYCNGHANPSGHSMFSQYAEQSTSRKSSEVDEVLKVNLDKNESNSWRNTEELNTSGSSKKSDPAQNSNDELLNNLDEQFNAFVAKNNYYDVIQNMDIASVPPDEILKFENQFLDIDNLIKPKKDLETDFSLKSVVSKSRHELNTKPPNRNPTDIETVKRESKTAEISVSNSQQTILNELLKPSPNFDDEDIINSIYYNQDCDLIHTVTTESAKLEVSNSTSNLSLNQKSSESNPSSVTNKVLEVPMMIMIDALVKEQPKSDSKLTQLLNHIEKENRLCQNSCSSQNMTPERLKKDHHDNLTRRRLN